MNQTTVQSSVIQLPTDPTIQDTIVQELDIQEKIVNDDHDKKPTKIKKPTKKRKTYKELVVQEPTIQESTDKHGTDDGVENEIDGKIDEQSSQETISKQPNYILQYFIFDNTEYDVDIIWEKGNPLFKAADIGKILDIQNIHTSIKNFDEDEKTLRQAYTLGGEQNVVYLTQHGVYRLTLNSKKPIAKHFKKWVFQVIDEINLAGRYEIEGNFRKELEQKDKRIKQSDHIAIINANHGKNIVYLGRIKKIGDKWLIKMGSTNTIKTRVTELIENFGSMEFFFVVECPLNRNYEQFLRKHHFIAPFAYNEPINEKGNTSIEVFLVTEYEIERMQNVIRNKQNLLKFQNNVLTAPPEDIQDIKTELKETKEVLKTLTETIIGQKIAEKEKKELFEITTDVRKHTQGKGPKIQRYSADGKTLLETYESFTFASRDNKVDNATRPQMNRAIKGNFVYKGFRWANLKRNMSDDHVQILNPTAVNTKNVKKGYVAMLNLDQTKIVNVFADQKTASEDRHFSSSSSICNAINRKSQSSGHYFKMWFDCSDELKNAYLKENKLPDRLATRNSIRVKQLDKDGNVKIFSSVQEVQKLFGVGRARLKEAIENDNILRGYKWSWFDDKKNTDKNTTENDDSNK